MALKIRETKNLENLKTDNKIVYQYKPIKSGIPNLPIGAPNNLPNYCYMGATPIKLPEPPPIEMPEADLPRALNYAADYGGCGWWRLFWPEMVLNGYNKGIVTSLTQMVLDAKFYFPIKSIRMQRQATEHQYNFIKELTKIREKTGLRLIYEIDDIVFSKDIPDYNRCKVAFDDENISKNILEIMKIVDEITVTCNFMKQYYIEKTGNKNVTVVPNYPPKFWLDRFYNEDKIYKNWLDNKKRPRILYAGSGTHIDVLNKTGGNDDFAHVVDAIIKARKDFKFVFKGAYPIALKPFIDNGEMEFIDWSPLFELPEGLYNTNCQAVFAPLADNTFNKSKSEIKIIESGAIGLPGAFQNLCTYDNAEFKFNNGDELIDHLKNITKDFENYKKYSKSARNYVEKMWLEDHIDEHYSVYYTDFGSPERNKKSPELIRLNPEQKNK